MRFIVALTGASGALYATRLLRRLLDGGHEIDLVASEAGCISAGTELGVSLNAHRLDASRLIEPIASGDRGASRSGEAQGDWQARMRVHSPREIGAAFAAGSVAHDGMVVVPCSMGTLGRIAHGVADSLITRSADVTIKEKRPLLLVTREMPLSLIHLRNMTVCAEAGATIFHACPHFYHRPTTVEEVVDTVVDRLLDHLGAPDKNARRWRQNAAQKPRGFEDASCENRPLEGKRSEIECVEDARSEAAR